MAFHKKFVPNKNCYVGMAVIWLTVPTLLPKLLYRLISTNFTYYTIEMSVSFRKTMYRVTEGYGEVEICLVLNFPATINLLVIISTKQDGDANGM